MADNVMAARDIKYFPAFTRCILAFGEVSSRLRGIKSVPRGGLV
jgi:hypothetical protein